MKLVGAHNIFRSIALLLLVCLFIIDAGAQLSRGSSSSSAASGKSQTAEQSATPGPEPIQPEDLVSVLKSSKVPKPLIIQVGFRVLYVQAHIPGSEYIGPASSPDSIRQLRKRVESLPRTQSIVLYCGCCPWNKCPNVNPASKELHSMGFKNVKILYIANNFGADWVDKGYPVAKGE